jgi:hypothetical protein
VVSVTDPYGRILGFLDRKQPFIVKNKFLINNLHKPRTWTDSLDKRPKLRDMDMRFGTRNVRRLYRAGSLMTVSRELARCKLKLVGVQNVS